MARIISLMWKLLSSALLILSGLILSSRLASAHHPMGGETPESFTDGLLSGLGHPIIGLDHFAFTVALAITAALVVRASIARRIVLCFIFAGTTIVGVLAMSLLRFDLPFIDLTVALSTLAIGAVAWWKIRVDTDEVATFAFLAGLVHGAAFSESIVGAEASPLIAYLLALAICQFFLIFLISTFAIRMQAATQNILTKAAGAGAMLIGLGYGVAGVL